MRNKTQREIKYEIVLSYVNFLVSSRIKTYDNETKKIIAKSIYHVMKYYGTKNWEDFVFKIVKNNNCERIEVFE